MKNAWIKRLFIAVATVAVLLIGFYVFGYLNNEKVPTAVVDDFKPVRLGQNPTTYSHVDKYQIPILMYHYIRDADPADELGYNLSVSPINFDLQMKWLKDNNYETMNMSDLTDKNQTTINKIFGINKKPIVITFDDGYEDAYTAAYPALKKYNFSGTFYIIRNYVGRTEYMNQSQIDALADAGMEIGSHSLSHPNLASLAEIQQRTQIFDSKLQATSFCYPAGKYNETSVALLKQAEYATAVTTKPGIMNESSNIFELPRVRVENGDGAYLKSRIDALLK